MKQIANVLHQWSEKLIASSREFMLGRYGVDRLNMTILVAGLVCSLISARTRGTWFGFILWALSYGLMIWAIFRCLSHNTYQRYQENRKYLHFVDRFRDRQNRYFDCPKCRQTVRVPRGKGKVSITCPKCREKFVKKT